MHMLNRSLVVAVAVLLGSAATGARVSAQARQAPRSQQATVTQDEIQRLQEQAEEVDHAIGRLQGRDRDLADRLQPRINDLRDEVIYLKVKYRKEGSVSRTELADTRDRLEQLRAQAVGDIPDNNEAQPGARPRGTTGVYGNGGGGYGDRDDRPDRSEPVRQGSGRPNEVPVGTEFDVRLQTSLSSETSQVEDPFEATTLVDLMSGGRVLVPAGSTVRGVVASVDKAGRIERKGRLTLKFDQMSVDRTQLPDQSHDDRGARERGLSC